jgi:hypothetical protein
MFYKESKNFLTQDEINFVDQTVLGDSFPWYKINESTTTKFPFFAHVLVERYDHTTQQLKINSDIFPFFEKIFIRFIKKHKIKIKQITRACVNLSYYHGIYDMTDPHVDHNFKHKVLMLYLNDIEGDTLVYNEKYKGEPKCVIPLETIKKPLKILKKISPEKGKIVCWDGEHYHTGSFCKPGKQRVVVVFTFI